MSHAVMRLLALVAFVLALLAFGATGSSAMNPDAGLSSPHQAEPTDEPLEDLIPCDPSYVRTIEPRIFQIGDETTVEMSYDFNCSGRTRKINFMLVIENSSALRQGRGGREALDNVIEGAQYFVNQVDFTNGSKGGLCLYASAVNMAKPLQGGASVQEALIHALGNISIQPIGSTSAAGAAIRDSTGQLPVGVVTDAKNIMIVIDAGMMVMDPPLIDPSTACNAARQAGVTVAVISFPAAQRRLASCATGGYFKQVSNDAGGNVKTIFQQLAEAMLRGKLMQDVEYSEFLRDGFEMVPGSEYPRPPHSSWATQFFWQMGTNAPQTVRYRVKASPELSDFSIGVPWTLSEGAELLFTFQDNTDARVRLPNPPICVYRHDPSECNLPTETPTGPAPTVPAPTDTPVPPDTPVGPTDTPDTPVVPTATDTPDTPVVPTDTPDTPDVPTDTPVVPTVTPPEPTDDHVIYLPAAYRNKAVGG